VPVDPTTYDPLTNVSNIPAVPLNIQTSLIADYFSTAVLGTPTIANGSVTAIPVVSGGNGYGVTVPTVTITGGGGSGATGTAILTNGVVTSITVAGGTGYTSTPTVTISSPVYAGSILAPTTSIANWNYMPINLGNPNAPEGSSFLINVNDEGTWLIMNSDIHESAVGGVVFVGRNINNGNYVLINDVNNNKIIKDGLGILVLESSNQYTGTTVVQQGILIVSNNTGLGDPLTNSNVEVYNGTLEIAPNQFGTNEFSLFGTTAISNRNLILYGGDGYIPTIGTQGQSLNIPLGQFNGLDGIFGAPNQWNGSVSLYSNQSFVTTSAVPGDTYGLTSGNTIANPTGDPSIGQDYASFTEINGVISGVAGLRKWGTGTVELTQSNTFSGDVVIFDGFLNARDNTALGPVSTPKNIIVREMPASLLAANQQLAGALTLGDEVNGGQSLVFGSQYNLILQDGNTSTFFNNGPDQNPGIDSPLNGASGIRVEGLGAFQVVSPSNNPNSAKWEGGVNVQTNASIGGSPNSKLLISGPITSTLPSAATAGVPTIAGGQVISIPVTSGSSGYLSAPTVTITGGGGTGATATAVLTNGVVTSITVTNGGANYRSVPTVTIASPGVQLEKRGSMTLSVSSDNSSTFGGSWLVSNGDLQVMNNNALGAATSVSVTQLSPILPALSGAGSIQVNGSGLNISNNVTIQGTGFNGFGALQSIGQNTWSGAINVAGTTSLGAGAGSELIVGGQITQAAGIPASSQLIKIGAGTVVVSKAQTSLNLPISVQEGTLLVQSPGNLGIGTNQVTVSTSVPVNSATLALDGGITISNRTLNLDGTGVAGAGALRSISGNNTWGGNVNLAGTMQLAYVGVDTGTLTLSGKINGGSSTLQKTGAGTLIISGSGNNQGSTVVGAGTVYQLGQDNVPVFVNTSGTLQGNGGIGVLNMTAGQNGTVTPGTQTSSVAVLTTSGISAQSSVGVFSFDLNTSGAVAGTAFDQIVVNGNVNLSGRPVLDVNLNFAPTARGTSYTIINNDGSDAVVGTFNGQAEGSLITVVDTTGNSVSYRISYVGGTGNDVTLTCVGVLTTNILTSSDVDNLTEYGQSVTFTSTISAVSGTVTSGTVTYFDQGVSIGQVPVVNGIATFTITTLSVNGSPHVITSSFVGQGIFADSVSNIIAQSVNKSSSSVAVTTNSQIYGTDLPLTVTATVTPQYAGGSATGQVLFRIDGVIQPLQTISTTVIDPTTGATTATLLTSISTTGFHTIDALYLGDSNINGSAFSPIFNQQILTTAITTLGLVSSRNPADRLATITFTASVTNPIIPAESTIGLVQFLDNGVALGAPVAVSNNVATYSTSTLTGGRHTITANYLGSPNGSNTRYFSSSSATIYQAVTATSNLVITGTNEGGGPQVNVYNLLTQETTNFFAFAPSFKGGVRVASGDVNGDGINDVVVAAGPGGGPQVNVYDGTSLQLVHSFYAYNAAFNDGIFVAVGDVNGDGYADIITGAGQGGGPHVQVFSGQNYSNIASFFAYNPVFTGGISVASGDVNGDGYSDVVVGAGPGGGPHVLAVSGFQLSQGTQVVLASFFAFDPGINRGVFVGAGDYNGDIVGDIVVAAGPGGGPHVKVFNGSGTSLIDTFFAYDINFAGGLSVAMADIDNDGLAEIVTAPYTNGGPEVKVFRYQKGQLYNFYAYDPLFTGGVFVG
jgi:autotransporter-associated beta strand protein